MTAYSDEYLDKIYHLLFCDDPDGTADLVDAAATEQDLRSVLNDPEAGSRQKITASNRLRSTGNPGLGNELYGVITEVSMPEGLDVLAVYEDGTARYINYSGKLVIWETSTEDSNKLVKDLFAAARNVVANIGPWDGERLPPPVEGNARLSFLTADGLYFGEGPFDVLAADPMGGAVIDRAGRFMAFLVEQTLAQSP